MAELTGRIFNIQHFSTEDGPGIRTTVFMKGCPLSCRWCANPESQNPNPQLANRSSVCIHCMACTNACRTGALSAERGNIRIDRNLCSGCGLCAKVCPTGSMFFYGGEKTVGEVFGELSRDAGYYETSGGGVSVSGGECMMQPEFVAELFKRCKGAGFHTVLDTCGYFTEQALRMVWDYVDLVLFDIKLMDARRHMQYTGVDNALIKSNLQLMLDRGMAVVIRIPVIPGVNDSEEELGAIARFVASLDKSLHVDLLPYHRFGERKYEMLGMEYTFRKVQPCDDSAKEEYKKIVECYGLDCTVH